MLRILNPITQAWDIKQNLPGWKGFVKQKLPVIILPVSIPLLNGLRHRVCRYTTIRIVYLH